MTILWVTATTGCRITPERMQVYAVEPGERRSEVVAFKLRYHDLRGEWIEPVVLEYPYGLLMWWSPDAAKRRLYLYDAGHKRVWFTRNFVALLRALKALPKGATIARLESCQAGFSWGMSDDDKAQLSLATLDKSVLSGFDHFLVVCTCEVEELIFPNDVERYASAVVNPKNAGMHDRARIAD